MPKESFKIFFHWRILIGNELHLSNKVATKQENLSQQSKQTSIAEISFSSRVKHRGSCQYQFTPENGTAITFYEQTTILHLWFNRNTTPPPAVGRKMSWKIRSGALSWCSTPSQCTAPPRQQMEKMSWYFLHIALS